MLIDEVKKNGKWEFDKEVAECFDDMLERSIPQYAIMRQLSTDLAKEYAISNTPIVDLGCARGGAIRDLMQDLDAGHTFIGIDCSMPMICEARNAFKNQENTVFMYHDLREGFPSLTSPSIIFSVLTLQFIPIEYRQKIIKDIYKSLRPGGAFILVEKVLGNSAEHEETFTKLYYELKQQNGYSYEDIKRKRYNLEGVLVPCSASWNEEMLRTAGFTKIDCFWKYLNFAGWAAFK